jgi:hypothetical protein
MPYGDALAAAAHDNQLVFSKELRLHRIRNRGTCPDWKVTLDMTGQMFKQLYEIESSIRKMMGDEGD